jgi:glutamate dehydrogenase (NAD(P)+)
VAQFTSPPAVIGQTPEVGLQRLSSTDGFVVVDLDGAERADGVIRWAKKVLADGARTLARSRTYAWAVLGEQVSGASAAVNASPEERTAALDAAIEELAGEIASGGLSLDAGKGVSPGELARWNAIDTRAPLLRAPSDLGPGATVADDLLAAGVVSASVAALGGLDGRTVALEGAGSAGPALVRAIDAAGGRLVAVATAGGARIADLPPAEELAALWAEHGDGLTAQLGDERPASAALECDADLLLCGSRAGVVDHGLAGRATHRAVVPVGPVPLTARALAVTSARGGVYLPDFISTAGPLLAARPADEPDAAALRETAARRIAELAERVLAEGPSPFLAACEIAESFLASWRDELPFGRPLA